MKNVSILLLFISFLSCAGLSAMAEAPAIEAKEQISPDSLALKLKRSAERSKEFALSKDTGNFLLFALSAGFLLYLPKHLSKYPDCSILRVADENFADYIIRSPKRGFFGKSPWPTHLYYELATLLAGYICLKTGKPVWNKLKKD